MIKAKATWAHADQYIGSAGSGHAIVVDVSKEKSANSPIELVLIALCGCTGSDVVGILRKKREPFTTLEVRAEADRAPDPPTVFTAIRLIYRVGGKVTHKAMEDAVHLSKEKYCSVSAMLEKTAKITFHIEYIDE
jgi:putative redox protein